MYTSYIPGVTSLGYIHVPPMAMHVDWEQITDTCTSMQDVHMCVSFVKLVIVIDGEYRISKVCLFIDLYIYTQVHR